MGNNSNKVEDAHQLIDDLSKSKAISNNILSYHFNSLLTLTQTSEYDFDKIVDIFAPFTEHTLQIFLTNLLTYHSLSKHSPNYPLNQVFIYIHALFRTFRTKYNLDIKLCLYDCINQVSNDNKNIYSIFPINLLKFSIETFIEVNHNISNENDDEQILHLINCLQILHKVIFSYNIVDIDSDRIVNIDLWKFILGNNDFISKGTFSTFINILFDFFFSCFEELVKNPQLRIASTTQLMKYSLGFILYLFHDPNYFLFEQINTIDKTIQVHLHFQLNNDFNEALLKYILISTNSNKHIKELIISYRELFHSLIELYMEDNSHKIGNFIKCLFDNYTSINENIRQILTNFILELLYIMPTIIDKCDFKFFIFNILNELKTDFEITLNFKYIILINKLFLTQAFKQLMSLITSGSYLDTCINYYLFFLEQINKSSDINLLTILIITLNNLCILFPKINNENKTNAMSKEYFSIMKNVLNRLEKEHEYIQILFINFFIENILLLFYKIEQYPMFVFELFKNFDYLNNKVKLIKLNDKIKTYTDKINKNFQEIINIHTKIHMKFIEEGININSVQDNHLHKNINKIMFFENNISHIQLSLKDISIHDNKIEKEILFSNQNEEHNIFDLVPESDFFSTSLSQNPDI